MRFLFAFAAAYSTSMLAASVSPAPVPASPVKIAPTKLIPLTDFATPTEVRTIALSPDGKTIAVTSPKGDYGTVLAFIDTATMKATAGFTDTGERVPGNVVWANNDRVILSIVRKFGGFAAPLLTGELIGVNRDGTRVKPLFGGEGEMQAGTHLKTRASDQGYAQLANPMVDDAKFALITVNAFSANGSFTELHRMNENSGAHTKLLRAPIRSGEFLLDHNDTARFAIGEDTDGAIKIFRREKDEWTIVHDEAKDQGRLSPIMFARDNTSFYAYWNAYKGPATLVRVDAKTMKRTEIYVPKTANPNTVFLTADRKDIYAILTQEGATKVEIINENAAEAKAWLAFSKSFQGSLVEPVDYSDHGQIAIFKVSASNNSGEYYLYDVEKRTAKFLFPSDSWMDPTQMAKTIPFQMKARDGLALSGYLTLPNVAPKNLPLVVMPHGGPHQIRDDDRYDDWAQMLASRGYAVLKVNFRGSTGYGTQFLNRGYHEWGRKMQDDLTDATQWAVKEGYADAERIAIAGASYGGYAALMGGVREPMLYKAVISYAGLSDLELMYTRGDIEDSIYGENYLKLVLGEDKIELKNRSPANLAMQIQAPVLIVHGGQDQRVPVVHASRMRDALKAAGKTVEYFEVRDEVHGFFKQANKVQAYTRMLAFLDKYLAIPPSVAKPN
jgi:dipeptidyl aminopeptidase/acylaminoacyl peptidase